MNDSFNSVISGGEYVRAIDGIPTPYGWWKLAESSALFVLIGVCIGLVVRWRIGPGNQA